MKDLRLVKRRAFDIRSFIVGSLGWGLVLGVVSPVAADWIGLSGAGAHYVLAGVVSGILTAAFDASFESIFEVSTSVPALVLLAAYLIVHWLSQNGAPTAS